MFPIDALTEEDKACIATYVFEFGDVMPKNIDDTLYSWNKNKIKLFKIMGNKLRITKEVEIPANKTLICKELRDVYPEVCLIGPKIFGDERYYGCLFTKELERYLYCNMVKRWSNEKSFSRLFDVSNVYHNIIGDGHIDFETDEWGKLHLPAGMKTMKAIQKFCEYTKFFEKVSDGRALYEEFRNRVSDICTKTKIKGKLVMSIHPIDYMTMSDNACNWSSCLSWRSGCYWGGTLELMNSNLAIVCYLESEKPFHLQKYSIPNKSWRCMYFAHKNILLSGNPYPFDNSILVRKGLDWLYELVYNNMHWDYKYKNQPYLDMKHRCNNEYTRQECFKHSFGSRDIIVYSYGLYNDFNIGDYNFYCYRNPVKKQLRLSLSGRATCLRCGHRLDFENEPSTSYRFNGDFDFKSRDNAEQMICYKCEECEDIV